VAVTDEEKQRLRLALLWVQTHQFALTGVVMKLATEVIELDLQRYPDLARDRWREVRDIINDMLKRLEDADQAVDEFLGLKIMTYEKRTYLRKSAAELGAALGETGLTELMVAAMDGRPSNLPEGIAGIETNVATMARTIEAMSAKVDKSGDKLEELSERLGSVELSLAGKIEVLAERVSTVEGRLKRIPSIWTIWLGQIVAVAVVAGIVIGGAVYYGVISLRPVTPPTTQAPR
jgi:hypothetical protein